MQTFLPSKNFLTSAQMLDSKRLNKQILECFQILNVLSGNSIGWKNHPAVKMWKNHEKALHLYVNAMIMEAKRRGIKTDKNENNIRSLFENFGESWGEGMPEWFFNQEDIMRITTTHKANLFRKDPLVYAVFQAATFSPYNVPCCDGCNYYWVTHKEKYANA